MAISMTPGFTIAPAGMALLPNIPLYFVSAASPVFSNNALNIADALANANQPIILWELDYNVLSWNSAWLLTPEGMVICPSYPQMVLGINSSNVVLCNRDDNDQSQYWTIAGTPGAYTIMNNQTQEFITAPDSQIVYTNGAYSPPLTTSGINGTPSPGQLWTVQAVVAQQPPNNQFYIQTALSGAVSSGANPYMLAAASSGAVIQQWQPGAPSQLWIFNADGTISPASNPGLVLNSTSNSNKSDNQVSLVAPSGSSAQLWTYSNYQLSVNMSSIGELYLNVNDFKQYNGAGVITWEQTNGTNESWYAIPAQSIPVGEWFYLQTEMTPGSGDNSPFVLALSGNVANAGTGVVIEPLQPGVLNQLWQINTDGVIISALDRSMALTAPGAGAQPVTIQSIKADLSWQQWFRLGNGMLGVGTSGNVLFLNVRGGGNAVAGTEVVIDPYQNNASNVLWNVIPYVPEPSGLWFTIQTSLAMPGAQTSYLFAALNDWNVYLKPPLGGYVLPQGEALISQLWRRTLNGHIVSAINPNLVLTGASLDGNVTLAPLQPGSEDQQWFWGYSQAQPIEGRKGEVLCGVLQNLGQGQVLWATSASNSTVMLQPAAANNDTGNQLWYVLPHGPAFDQSTTIRNIGGADEVAGLFLSLPAKADSSGGFMAMVNQQSGNPALSMWQFKFPGYIASDTNPDIVLSLELGSGSTPQSPVYTNNVVAYPRQPSPQPFQLWTATADGLIVNQYNGQALTASAASTPSNVITSVLADDPNTMLQLWDFSPGMALQTTLVQPTVPFPAWTAGQAKVYQDISKELGLPYGIRSQYANLAAPLSSYQLHMNLILLPLLNAGVLTGNTKPSKEEVNDWISVVMQLNKEIGAVNAIQLLFQQVTALHLSLSQAQAMTLSELITGCELTKGLQTTIPPQKKKRSWIGDLIEGLTYTMMNAAGSFVGDPKAGEEASMFNKFVKNGLPCIANLMSTGFATCQGAQQPNSAASKYLAAFHTAMQNIYNYEMTVLEMQQMLLNEFEAVGSALGQIEALILSDWGKLQVVYDMTRSPGAMSSLFWPSIMTPIQANQMLSGYTIGALQTLMPANADFKINATMHANYGNLLSEGWQSDGSFISDNSDGTQNIYSTTINQQIMDTVWASGTDPISFFKGMNGWNVPINYQNMVGTDDNPLPEGAAIIVTIQNFTDQELTLNLALNSLVGMGSDFSSNNVFPATTKKIAAYGAQEFAGACWECYYNDGGGHSGSSGYIPSALQGNISIADTSQQTIMSVHVDNSYNTNNNANYNLPATYSWSNYTCEAPYRVTIYQDVTSSGMVLVTFSITIDQ